MLTGSTQCLVMTLRGDVWLMRGTHFKINTIAIKRRMNITVLAMALMFGFSTVYNITNTCVAESTYRSALLRAVVAQAVERVGW